MSMLRQLVNPLSNKGDPMYLSGMPLPWSKKSFGFNLIQNDKGHGSSRIIVDSDPWESV
jgi:hypothetical protein